MICSIVSNSKNSAIQDKYNLVCENLALFDITHLEDLHDFIKTHPDKTTPFYVKHFTNHKFTDDSFEYLLHQINKNRNTYHGIGPFMKKNDKWYTKHLHKKDFVNIIKSQQEEIERLTNLLYDKRKLT